MSTEAQSSSLLMFGRTVNYTNEISCYNEGMKILIIGGSRFVGPVLIEKLLSSHHELTVFNRGRVSGTYPPQVTFVAGDRNVSFEDVSQQFDTVIDMCSYNGEQTKKAITELDYDFFLHFGSVASYEKSDCFPLAEDAPSGFYEGMSDYGRGKVECENALKDSGVKYATIRPTYILGANNYCDRENFIYRKLNSGDALVLPGNAHGLAQYVFVEDVAASIALLAEKQTPGAFNCVGDELVSANGLVRMMAETSGTTAIVTHNPTTDGMNHDEAEYPFSNENLICTNQKLKDLGISFTPLTEGLKRDFNSYYKLRLSKNIGEK
jgi:nucleoside-diphosphate-sugar epimerase